MRHFWVGRSPVGLLLIPLVFVTMTFARAMEAGLPANAPEPISPSVSVRAEPPTKLQFLYAGSYLVDGKFQLSVKTENARREDSFIEEKEGHPAEVPSHFNLHSHEQTVENLLPRYRAKKSARGQSFWAAFRDDVVTFAYGHERVLAAPQRVVTDSTGRVIVVDPAGASIHVLAPEHSFRILSGRNRRVETPAGVAVDADDNIYVSDIARGIVVVFDRTGKFLRCIGQLGNETLFHYPTGIAIDRHADRLYVLDTERHLMFVMDLQGHEIKRVGRYNGNDTVIDLLYPTEVTVGHGTLAILDSDGQRIWITDLDGNPVTSYLIAEKPVTAMTDRIGLAIDSLDNVYVSQPENGRVRVYNRDGRLLTTFGGGDGAPRLAAPTGVWIDGSNRLFLSDETNRRVEVFQLTTQAPAQFAGVH